jgi:hypothetical protein
MRFQVLVDEEPNWVEFRFGGRDDIGIMRRWRSPHSVRELTAVKDTLEFARLASKRWQYYGGSLPVASSEDEFRRIIREDDQAEVSMLFVLSATWFRFSSVLAFAQCRRTYCNNVVLEFLGTHPRLAGKVGSEVIGIGSGALCCLVELAHNLGVETVWGEATNFSARFYSRVLETPIEDHFFIEGALMEHCRRKFADEMMGTA